MDAKATASRRGLTRFGQILRREAVGGTRGLLITAAAVGGTVIIISLLTALGLSRTTAPFPVTDVRGMHDGFFVQLLFIGGFIFSSLAFREAHQGPAGTFYMMLPGSALEKFAAKLVMSSIGFAVAAVVIYSAAAALGHAVSLLVLGRGPGLFNPFSPAMLKATGGYVILQSVYLLGSIWFRKAAFLRTVLWITILAIGVVVVAAVSVRLALADQMTWSTVPLGNGVRVGGWSLNLDTVYLLQHFSVGTPGGAGIGVFKVIGQVVFYAIAPACWAAAYFRLRETEV